MQLQFPQLFAVYIFFFFQFLPSPTGNTFQYKASPLFGKSGLYLTSLSSFSWLL